MSNPGIFEPQPCCDTIVRARGEVARGEGGVRPLTPAAHLRASFGQFEAGKMTSLQLAVALSDLAPCAESLIKAGADPSLKNAVSDPWLGSGLADSM